MEVISQLQNELKDAVNRREALTRKLNQIEFCIGVFQKEVALRKI